MEEFYDFSDASNYKITKGVSGIVFTGVNLNLTFLQNDITNINTDGLRTKNDVLTLTIPHSANFTICLVMQFCINRNLESEIKTLKDFYEHYYKKY